MLLSVAVSTSDSVPDVFNDRLGKGFPVGAPDVSSVVCATCNKDRRVSEERFWVQVAHISCLQILCETKGDRRTR